MKHPSAIAKKILLHIREIVHQLGLVNSYFVLLRRCKQQRSPVSTLSARYLRISLSDTPRHFREGKPRSTVMYLSLRFRRMHSQPSKSNSCMFPPTLSTSANSEISSLYGPLQWPPITYEVRGHARPLRSSSPLDCTPRVIVSQSPVTRAQIYRSFASNSDLSCLIGNLKSIVLVSSALPRRERCGCDGTGRL